MPTGPDAPPPDLGPPPVQPPDAPGMGIPPEAPTPPPDNAPAADDQALERPPENASPEAKSEYNLKRIAAAMQQYQEKNQKFPSSASYGAGDKPLLSWRVHLLPFMGLQDLYKKFKLDEPWNGPNNQKMLADIPEVYRTPQGPTDGRTCYQVPVGLGTVFGQRDGMAENLIGDGKEYTILVTEVDLNRAVNWTEPADLRYVPAQPTSGLGELRGKAFLAAFCDGSVRRIPVAVGPDFVRALFTANGKDSVDMGQLDVQTADTPADGGKPAEGAKKKLEGYLALADAAMEKQDLHRAISYLMADAAVRGSEDVLRYVRWCPALKRPVLMIRVGVAVQGSAATTAAPTARTPGAIAGAAAQAEAMRMWTEAVGNPMLEKIHAVINEGKMGSCLGKSEIAAAQAPPPSNEPPPGSADGRRAPPKPREAVVMRGPVASLGLGEQGRIRQTAFKEGLDAVFLVAINNKPAPNVKPTKGRTPPAISLQSTLVLRLLDVAKNDIVWSSAPVTAMTAPQGGRLGGVPPGGAPSGEIAAASKQVLDELGAYLEKSLTVTDMPALTPESVQNRAETLAGGQYSNPLPVLMELRYYQSRKLLTPEQIGTYLTKIVGDKDGPTLAAGPEAERKQIVEKWIGQ
jgi:hypothetical protein